jgi:hypothetical protein
LNKGKNMIATDPENHYDRTKDFHEVVSTILCPICNFKQSDHEQMADFHNDGTLRCPKCGLVTYSRDMRYEGFFGSDNPIRALVHAEASLLTYLGPGSASDWKQAIHIASPLMFQIGRVLDGQRVDITFWTNFSTDVERCRDAKVSDPNFPGVAWIRESFETFSGKKLSPALADFFQKLAESEFGLSEEAIFWRLGNGQSGGELKWIKGAWHRSTHGTPAGIRVDVTWSD